MIAVFFGGRSCEHDISIITGLQALSACRDAVPVYIDSDGIWWTGTGFDSVSAVKYKRFKGTRVHLRPGEHFLYSKNKKLKKIDVALLCMHGMYGEDGSLQGMLKMTGIPYTGSDVLASAMGMNKLESKRVFEAVGLKVLPYISLTREEYEKDLKAALKRLRAAFGFPVIVKPCDLGSSIGISIAGTQTELFAAMRVAFEWDDVIIIEKALDGFIEVNCAVLGDAASDSLDALTTSETEQPVGWKDFLTFSDKYAGDVKTTRHKIPADIGELNYTVKNEAVKAFAAIGCAGVARVDFLIKDGEVYINEINTIPGSLAYPLFRSDMSLPKFIDKLIDIAVKRYKRENALKRVYTPIEPIVGK